MFLTEYNAEEAHSVWREEGVDEGIGIGEKRGMLKTLRDLVHDGVLSVGDAAERAGMSISDFEAKVAALT